MGHHHHHDHHHPEIKGKNLGIAIFLNVLITLSQVTGALIGHSLSLMTDALHNLSDVMALLISYIANKVSKRKHTQKQSFGYKRAEILAAFINAATLLGVSLYLIIEAVDRVISGNEILIKGNLVAWLAGLSILANGLSVLLIYKDSKHSMNMKAAYLHLFTDMLTSVAVLIGGLMMNFYQIYWIDSMLSVIIAIYLIVSSWKLVVKSSKVLMQFTPGEIDMYLVEHMLVKIPEIKNIHHVHIWQLTDTEYHFEAHVDFEEDKKLSEVDVVLDKVRKILLEEFNITHVTLQSEYCVCEDKAIISQEKRQI